MTRNAHQPEREYLLRNPVQRVLTHQSSLSNITHSGLKLKPISRLVAISRPMNLIRPRMNIPKFLGENYSDKNSRFSSSINPRSLSLTQNYFRRKISILLSPPTIMISLKLISKTKLKNHLQPQQNQPLRQ